MNNRTIKAASILGVLTLSVFLPAASCWAAAAGVLTYQGRLKESGLPASGARSIDILLCDALTGGLCHATGSQSVSVSSGLFRTTFTVPGTVDLTAGPWYLEIKVGALTLSPRELLTSSPYAVFASTAGSVVAGAIDTAKLAPDAVTATAILNGAVTNAKIAAGAVDAAKIVAGAVSTLHLAAGAVDTGKLASAAVGSSHIQAGAVDSSKLAAGAVDSGKLAANAVAGANIQAGVVDSSKLAVGAIDSGKLAANAVSAANIQAGAVDSSKLASGAVDSSKLAAGAVDTGKLAAAAVTAAALAPGSVANAHIQAGVIDSGKLTPNSVWAGQIAPGAVDSTKLAAGAVDSTKLAANSVAGVHILAGAVDSGKLAAGAVDSGKLALGAVDSTKLASDFTSLARVSGGLIVIPAADTTKIGIGTTNPTATLHIAAGGIRFPDNSLMNTAATGGSATNVDNPTDALVNADSDISGTGGVGLQIAGANKLFITNAGKVGIGSTDAAEALDLSGAMVFRGMAAPGVSNADQGKLYYDSAADKIKVSENGSVFTNLVGGVGGAVTLQGATPGASDAGHINVTGTGLFGGNLGVGTTAPGSKLHVSGGDIQVGDATPSILSASGYLTMANLAAAPAAAAGRVYYDSNGDGALKVRLNSGGFLSVVAGSVDSAKLAAGAVGATHIQAGAVDSSKLAAGSVDSGKIAVGAVDSGKLAANSVWAPHLAAGSVDSTKLAASSVWAPNLASGSVDTAKIAAGVVDSSKLASDFNSLARVSGGLIVIPSADTGKVGIGTSNPSEKVHVYANTPSANFKFEGAGANANPNIVVKAAAGGGNAGIVIDRSDTGGRSMLNWYNAGTMKWQFELPDFTSGDSDRLDLRNAAGTKVLTAKQSGNIGIGESIPATTLDVLGNAQFGTSATRSTFSAAGALTLAKDSGLTLSGSGGTLASGSSITASAFFGNGSALTGINASDNTKVAKAGDAMTGDLTINAGLAVTNGAGVGATGLTGGLLVVKSTTATSGQPALQVQNNAGTGLLRIQQDGSVGIGTTASATYELQVSKNSSSQLTANTPVVWIENTNATPASGGNANVAQVLVNAGNGAVGGGLSASSGFVGAGALLNNNLVLRSITNHPIDVAPNDTFSTRFTADGKVGIGTTNPGARLQVNHAEVDKGIDVQSALPRIRLTETDQVSPAGEYEFTSDGDSMRLYRGAIGSQTALLVVKGNGSVGIGTTNPAGKLDVTGGIINVRGTATGASNNDGIIGFWDNAGTRAGWVGDGEFATQDMILWSEVANVQLGSAGGTNGNVRFLPNNVERMRIQADGKVGIGTTNPSQALDVNGLLALGGQAIANYSAGTITLGDINNGDGLSPTLAFKTNDVERVRIDGNGNVGIGTSAPATRLDVSGDAQFGSGTAKSTFTANGSLAVPYGVSAGSATLTATGNTQYSLTTSSGITVGNSAGVYAGFFVGSGAGLTNVTGTDNTKVLKAGDSMTGNLNLNGGKLQVSGTDVLTASRLIYTADGSAASPAHSFGSDTGVGLYRPAAATLGVVTAGTERGRFDSGGLLVTGNMNATGAVQISGTNIITSGRLLQPADGAVTAPAFAFFNETNSGMYRSGAGVLSFGTFGVERMKLNSTGLGITVAGAGRFEAARGDTPADQSQLDSPLLRLTGVYDSNVLGGPITRSEYNADAQLLMTAAGASPAGRLGFLVPTGSERLSILSNGNVGIGTTAPGGQLHVVGAPGTLLLDGTNAAPELTLRRDQVLSNGNTITRMLLQGKDAGGTMRNFWDVNTVATDVTAGAQKGDLVLTSYTGVSPSERVRITQAGNVGIATSGPNDRLEIGGNGNLRLRTNAWLSGGIRFYSDLAGASASDDYYFQRGGVDSVKDYLIAHIPNLAGSKFSVATSGNVHRMTVDGNSGNVGIGTTNPSTQLEIAGTSAGLTQTRANGAFADAPDLIFQKARGTVAAPSLVADGDKFAIINFLGHDGSAYRAGALIAAKVDGAPGAGDMPGRLEFYTTPDGSITSAERMRITQAGNVGIGLTSPSDVLDVRTGNNGAGLTISAPNNSAAGSQPALVFKRYSAGSLNTVAKIMSGECSTGLPTCGDLAFQTGNSGSPTTNMVVNSAGNVGIGTVSPGYILDVQRNTVGEESIRVKNTGGSTSSHAMLHLDKGVDGAAAAVSFRSAGAVQWDMGALDDNLFTIRDSVNNTKVIRIEAGSWASSLHIKPGGLIGIATNNPLDRLHVAGDIRVGTGANGCLKDADATVLIGTCSSDARMKKDVRPFPDMLDKLSLLRPVHFHWKPEEFPEKGFGAAESFGLVAQEVEEILPELVTQDEKGYKAVRYNKLPFMLLQAVRELRSRNEALARRVTELEHKAGTPGGR